MIRSISRYGNLLSLRLSYDIMKRVRERLVLNTVYENGAEKGVTQQPTYILISTLK